LAGVCGLHRTAKALRVNYYVLKKRVEREAASSVRDVPEATVATFRELAAAGPACSMSTGPCECTLELEDADGAKMRVHVSGIATPDLVALSRSFWRAEP